MSDLQAQILQVRGLTCLLCGNPFNATQSLWGIYPTICGKCSEFKPEVKANDVSAKWEALCPDEFRLIEENGRTDLERLKREQPKLDFCMKWLAREHQHMGLILKTTTSGKCKTRCMWRVVKALFDQGKTVRVFTWAQFDRECKDACGKYVLTEWFDGIKDADYVFIDDVGKGSHSDFTLAQLFDLIDYRSAWGKPMLYTTNEDKESLESAIEEKQPHMASPLIRRIREFCYDWNMKI